MNKLLIWVIILMLLPIVYGAASTLVLETSNGDITFNTSIIAGTNISCNDVIVDSGDACNPGGAGGSDTNETPRVDALYSNISVFLADIDTNVSTICTADEVLLGNGTCTNSSSLGGSITDTNASTACTGDEALLGNGSCLNTSLIDTTIADTNYSGCGDGEYGDGSNQCINFNSTVNSIIDSGVTQLFLESIGFNITTDLKTYFDSLYLPHTIDTNETARFINLTATDCSGTDKVVGVYDNGTVKCDADTGGGGAGDKWVDGGDYIYPNTTFADNINVFGYIGANNWTNVSITESQISDLAHTIDTNVTTACTADEVLLGNGTCTNSSSLGGSITDTNETTRVDAIISNYWNMSANLLNFTNLTACADNEIMKMNGANWNCEADSGIIYDQSLNTTDDVKFSSVNITTGNFTIGNWSIVVNETTIQVYISGTRKQVLDSDGTLHIKGDIITNDESV